MEKACSCLLDVEKETQDFCNTVTVPESNLDPLELSLIF